jgi:hypothetical protein
VQQTAHFNGVNRTGTVLPVSAPARDEKFTFARFGGLAALRVRASFQSDLVRGTVAGGLGVSYKQLLMKREATATDSTGRRDSYVPDGVSYVSPAISLEGAVELRVSGAVAIALGLEMWADNASIWGTNAAPQTSGHVLLANPSRPDAPPAPIPTPQYHFASGSQVFLGPFLGMQFGP